MIPLEKQVTNLELTKDLKEAGYVQEGLWWWWINKLSDKGTPNLCSYGDSKPKESWTVIVAPTVAELGEALPVETNTTQYESNTGAKGLWICEQADLIHHERANTEADARAKMYLYLKKEGLL